MDSAPRPRSPRRAGSDWTTASRGYVERMRDPLEGLVPDGAVDPGALETFVRLRSTYLPRDDGVDPLTTALDEEPGLVHRS